MHRFIVIVALTWTACTTPSAVEGQIAAIDGRVLLVEKGEERLAAVGDVLRYGQAVLTDASSRASIALRGGHAVEMTENSVLALNQPKGPKASLGATLERGSARVTSPHTNVILEIGTPFGLTELGGTDTRADISHDTGLTVDVGTIVVHAIAGNTIAVSAGQQFTIAGIVIALEKPPAAKLQANAKTSKRDTKRRKRKRRLKAALSNTAAVADVVESKPKSEAGSVAAMRELVLRGDYVTAEAALDAHLNRTPNDAAAWLLLGDTRRKMKKWKPAALAYSEAATHGVPTMANRARFLAGSINQDKLEDHVQAVKLFEAYLSQSKSTQPLAAAARMRLANSLFALGKEEAARNELRKLVSSHPKSPEAAQAQRLLGG